MTTVAILGAGAWGTAMAVHLAAHATAKPQVLLWTRDAAAAKRLSTERENRRYLPGISLPDTLQVTSNLAQVASADVLFLATPVAALTVLATQLAAVNARAPLLWLAKGLVTDASLPAGVGLAHQLLAPLWKRPVGIVSGPSFADEVARGLPTALTVAATDASTSAQVAALLRGGAMRAYETDDIVGVEAGGAIKNVLAIAAGASDGLGFGHNARAALITRGLAETVRLASALGGRPETLMGLAGLGDLVLTCTGDLSRNRRVGLALAAGKRLPEILAELGHVAEGVTAARNARLLALHLGVDMPICAAVDEVLHADLPVRQAVAALLQREPRPEGQ